MMKWTLMSYEKIILTIIFSNEHALFVLHLLVMILTWVEECFLNSLYIWSFILPKMLIFQKVNAKWLRVPDAELSPNIYAMKCLHNSKINYCQDLLQKYDTFLCGCIIRKAVSCLYCMKREFTWKEWRLFQALYVLERYKQGGRKVRVHWSM